jgi:hypothetical protein
MSDRANLVRVLTSSTGTSTMTLGAAYSQLFITPAEAGMLDGRTYTYLIVDGNNWELGKGVYTASGTTLSRVTVLASRIAGTLGTSKITLTGTAQVRITESADDMGALRGTRTVTGTSDTIANTDLGRAITYSNASAIAVSLAQAGASSQFLDGWTVHVKNTGAGTLTITPATSTINGGSTLVLAQNMGAFIWSDGSNYHAYFMPLTKPLLAANNLADLASAATAWKNIAQAGAVIDSAYAEHTTNAAIASTIQVDDSIPQSTEGTEILTVSITPKSTTNKLRVRFVGQATPTAANNMVAAMFLNSETDARAARYSSTPANFAQLLLIEHEFVPGSTSVQTIKIRVGTADAGNMRFNGNASARIFGGVNRTTLLVEEIVA